MNKSHLLCWQADFKNYDKALRRKVRGMGDREREMSYPTNNTASQKKKKNAPGILLEFKIIFFFNKGCYLASQLSF